MSKCHTCKKEITKPYFFMGKMYGYNCYKMQLSLHLAKIQELKNDDYFRKCIALISILENKDFRDQWNKDFKKSILDQWNNCKKLTGKQFECIFKKFNDVEEFEYNLIYFELCEEVGISFFNNFGGIRIFNMIESVKLELYSRFFDDFRFLKCANRFKKRKHFITIWEDVEDKKKITQYMDERQLNELKNDEYIVIHRIIDIQEEVKKKKEGV